MSARPREQVTLYGLSSASLGHVGQHFFSPHGLHTPPTRPEVSGDVPVLTQFFRCCSETGDEMMIDRVRFSCISHKTVSVTIKWQGLKKRRIFSPIPRPCLHTTRAVHRASLVKNTSHRGSVIELTG